MPTVSTTESLQTVPGVGGRKSATRASTAMAGEYTEEHNVDEIELTDIAPPKLVKGLASYRVTKSVQLTLHCVVQSSVGDRCTVTEDVCLQVPCIFRWSINGHTIDGDIRGRVHVHTTDTDSTLTVTSPDAGEYRVQATNGAGAATSYGCVNIICMLFNALIDLSTYPASTPSPPPSTHVHARQSLSTHTSLKRAPPPPSAPVFACEVPNLTVNNGGCTRPCVHVYIHQANISSWTLACTHSRRHDSHGRSMVKRSVITRVDAISLIMCTRRTGAVWVIVIPVDSTYIEVNYSFVAQSRACIVWSLRM
jgi:hypothetical protein